jgi:hypothetical protein
LGKSCFKLSKSGTGVSPSGALGQNKRQKVVMRKHQLLWRRLGGAPKEQM